MLLSVIHSGLLSHVDTLLNGCNSTVDGYQNKDVCYCMLFIPSS